MLAGLFGGWPLQGPLAWVGKVDPMIYSVHVPEACFPHAVVKADSLDELAIKLLGKSAIVACARLANEATGPDMVILSYELKVAYVQDFKIETADFVVHCID